ncbi:MULTISPECIES: hypothetical protein [unclassified Sinorhizobium]|uniref:DUF7674 family protein n=1 Tax=unclassified Sinorhizobium TaxID=2613772 RepID=UPI003523742D
MSALTVSFACHLAFRFRELLPVLAEHIQDNSGEILPHILMYDYCRFVCGGPDGEHKWQRELLGYLENNFSESDDEISNLIAVSFIENIPDPLTSRHWSVQLLGEKMAEQYSAIYGT